MQVAILSHNARAGDAIGNQIAEKVGYFLDGGADVRVFVEDPSHLHPSIRGHYELFDEPQTCNPLWRYLETSDLLVVEYGHYYRLLDLVPLLSWGKPRIVFDYYGVTPPQFWVGVMREAAENALATSGLAWCAEATLVHSGFSAIELGKHARLPRDRMQVLPLPIDSDHFCPGPGKLREKLGIGAAPLVLFVGRLAPNKRVSVLVEALHLLRAALPHAHLAIAGDISDVYQIEADRCLQRAQELGLADRVHLLGRLTEEELLDAYRSAVVLVTPSVHEGFCVPVVEAQACGLPVVAARATALTETVGDAGLTFKPDDADDLAFQLQRVFVEPGPLPIDTEKRDKLRVAIVSVRYGSDVVGGAESSFRTIAQTLTTSGHHVEVFTTCACSEGDWANDLPEGTITERGVRVHRFQIDPHDRSRHLATVQRILATEGHVDSDAEEAYLANSIHSRRLIEALQNRADEFDAMLTGPYLFGLTHDVVKTFGERILLVPCFHDEPFAKLQAWPSTYTRAGGVLYHSLEEQCFAQQELGMNHPRAVCMGTWIDTACKGDEKRGRERVGSTRPYLLYCGRYSPQKNLPLVFEYARLYENRQPGRFTFGFAGTGDLRIPKEPWARDLGFVAEDVKADLLRGAVALIQLSSCESLSLVALEAWGQETPVLVNRACAVLNGHVSRSGGGESIASFDEFATCLDSIWKNPEEWQEKGPRGCTYVEKHFGERDRFKTTLVSAIESLRTPIRECMIERGVDRAKKFSRANWRKQFGGVVDSVLHTSKPAPEEILEIVPRSPTCRIATGASLALLPVRVCNRGTLPAMAEGPARWEMFAQVLADSGDLTECLGEATPLPCLLVPGQEVPAVMRIPGPAHEGVYAVSLSVKRAGEATQKPTPIGHSSCKLVVGGEAQPAGAACCTSLLDSVHQSLAQASTRSLLPDDYLDVTEGLFARWKRWLKRKLLGNFKHAYVDVLSRQQSAFNCQLVTAARELAECCATLDHALRLRGGSETQPALGKLLRRINMLALELGEYRRLQAALEARLDQLEEKLGVPSVGSVKADLERGA